MKTKNLDKLVSLACCSVVLAALAGNVVAELPFQNDGNLYVAMYNSDSNNIFTKSGEPRGTLTAPGLNVCVEDVNELETSLVVLPALTRNSKRQ